MRNYRDEIEDLRHLDPLEGTRLVESWSNSDTKTALFLELRAAKAGREAFLERTTGHRRRVLRRVLALAASLAVASVGIVVASGVVQRTSTSAFAVRELPNGVIEIQNVTDLHDASALEAELREFGVDVEIITETASPSAVGRARAFAPGLSEGAVKGLSFGKDGTRHVFRWRIDPNAFDDRIVITLYVEPQEGEQYAIAEEVFEPGEILAGLHCALGTPLRASDVTGRVTELGITPQWYVLSDFSSETVDSGGYHSERSSTVPEGEVLSGYAVDEHTVRFEVVPDDVTVPEWLKPRLSDVPCTDEQAARWR